MSSAAAVTAGNDHRKGLHRVRVSTDYHHSMASGKWPSFARHISSSSLLFQFLKLFGGAGSSNSSPLWIVRHGVACSHLFLYMTLASLVLASLQQYDALEKERVRKAWILPNLVFQILYSLCYASFLVLYYFYDSPSTAYVVGIALYFMGYTLFLVLFAVQLSTTSNNEVVSEVYVSASCCFLVGSAFLAYATVPSNREKVHAVAIQEYSPFRQGAALFWGSCSFLVGATALTIDSALALSSVKLESHSRVSFGLLVTGLASFAVGRVFFLWGSTTDKCDIWFRDQTICSIVSSSCEHEMAVEQAV